MLALQLLDGTPYVPGCDDTYVRVRLTQPARATDTVTVFLPNGTGLVVSGRDLVRLVSTPER
jgi:hypothetical protein